MKKRRMVLLLGTEPLTLSQICIGLEDAGYKVQITQDLDDCLTWIERSTPALMVLDGGSNDPAHDPWQIGRRLCQVAECPIVMLLPEGTRAQQCVEALQMGMDDCLVRPFHMQELIARIRRIIWRLTEAGTTRDTLPRLSMDPINQMAIRDNMMVHLTPTEFRLLYILFLHAGQPLSYAYLEQAVWGHADEKLYNRLKLFIWQLRQKIESNPKFPKLIITEKEPGGYSLRVAE